MKSPRALRLFLALLLILSITGCKNTPHSSTETPSEDKTGSKPITLTYYTIGTPDADLKQVNDALNKVLEKKLNIHIDYNKINWSDYGRSLATIINSGTNFDVAFATEGDQGDYSGNARRGAWLALDPYLKTIGKEMYNTINPLLWEGVKINEKIYGVPTNKEVAVPEWWIYKKEIVDKYHLDISKYRTLESLGPLFKMLHQKEPEYTIMELDQYSHNFFSLEGYEYIVNRDIPLMVKSTDKSMRVVDIYETDLAKRTLNTLRQYYKSGYINEDAAVRAGSSLGRDPLVFWREGGAGPYSASSWSKDTGFEVVAQQVSPTIVNTESARGGIMVVNSRTRYPEACIKFLNCLNTDPEVRNLINFGIEGVHYDLTSDGQVAVRNDSGYAGVQYTQGNWFILKTLKGDPKNKWEEYKRFNSEAIKSEVLDFTPDISDPALSSKLADVIRVTSKYYPSLMTGTVDPKV
ncbi:MAG TPA: ABC transporter substrate-binding protein, partial [Ruminiclostridium sp.]|nr:ABC transporter substrate-binding protein [Ruminiclostridium sp.]